MMKRTNMICVVPLWLTFDLTNRSPILNSPTIIAKVHIILVIGSEKCSRSFDKMWKHSENATKLERKKTNRYCFFQMDQAKAKNIFLQLTW